MANGWQTDPYGNQVWMPINPGADPGTAWAQEELGEVESLLGEDAWQDYGGYFDRYGTGEFYEKEKMQRVGAGIDIGQLGKAWQLKLHGVCKEANYLEGQEKQKHYGDYNVESWKEEDLRLLKYGVYGKRI